MDTLIDNLLRSAQWSQGQGDFASAADFYKMVVQQRPDNYGATYLLAVALYRTGKVEASLEAFEQAIRIDPRNVQPYRDRGLILLNKGDYLLALASFDAALELQPNLPEFHINRGIALKNLGRLIEAIDSQHKAISLDPESPQAYNNLAIALSLTDAKETAVENFRKAIALKPNYAEAYNNLGIELLERGESDEAIGCFQKAVDLKSDYVDAWSNLGLSFKKQKNNAKALKILDQAIAINPKGAVLYMNRGVLHRDMYLFHASLDDLRKAVQLDGQNPEFHYQLGETLIILKSFHEALASFDAAVKLKADYWRAWDGRGAALRKMERFDEALVSIDRALELKLDFAEAYSNRANVLRGLKRFDEAMMNHRKAIALAPDGESIYLSFGATLTELRRLEEALACYNKAVELRPEKWEVRFARSWFLLSCGNYQDGFADYEYRKLDPAWPPTVLYDKPFWSGEQDLTDKSILIEGEQGLGDTIQFARYIDLVSKIAGRVYFAPQSKLIELFRGAFACELIDLEKDSLPEFDYHTPLMSLPLSLRTSASSIPRRIPYLEPDPKRIEKWKSRIGSKAYKIAICWQGSNNSIDLGRSLPLKQFEPLSGIPGVRLISIHKGLGENQIKMLPSGMTVETLGEDFDNGDQAFLDTAAVMKVCDLVITSDTSVAHLAGALGVPTWVVLRYVPDWRWLLDGEDCPWYPTMRLFRQKSSGDWPEVFKRIAAELERMV